MAGSGEHIKALVRSHASGDDASFYAVALQVAAHAARQGHNRLASDLKSTVERSRQSKGIARVTPLAQTRGDLADLAEATYPSYDIADLIGPKSFIDQVQQVILEQRQRHSLLDRGFAPLHRLLLEGPPGTGKTMTAAVLARELSIPLITVRLDSVFSKFLGETANKLRLIFQNIETQRAVYLFDEFDALGSDRSVSDVGEARRILNSFLVMLEQVSSESVVIAATNHRKILDRALFRRFDILIRYSLPDRAQAISVMKSRLGPLGREINWETATKNTVGLSHAELVGAAEIAAKAAILSGREVVDAKDVLRAIEIRKEAHFE